MIIPGLHAATMKMTGTFDDEAIRFFCHSATQFIQFFCHSVEPVAFLETDTGCIDNMSRTSSSRCKDSQHGNQIRAVSGINDCPFKRRRSGGETILFIYTATHPADDINDDFITLGTVTAESGQFHIMSKASCSQPECRLGIIPFYFVLARPV